MEEPNVATAFVNLQKHLKSDKRYTVAQIKELVKKHFVGNTVDKIGFASIGTKYELADEAGKKLLEKYVEDIKSAYSTPPAPVSMDKLKTVMENPMLFVQNNFGMMAIVTKHLSSPELKQLGAEMVKKYDLLSHTTVDKDKIVETVRKFVNSDDFPVIYDHIHKLFSVMQDNLKL